MEEHPNLEGARFEEVMLCFPTCTPLGVINEASILLCPDRDYRLRHGDEVVMLRQSGSCHIRPLPQPIRTEEDGWQPRMSSSAFAMVRPPPRSRSASPTRMWPMHGSGPFDPPARHGHVA